MEVLAAPRGLDAEILDVVITDPEDVPDTRPGDLALLIGARGRAAAPAVREAARRGATAVAVKEAEPLREVAVTAGITLLAVRPEVRWEHLESLARNVVATARGSADLEAGESLGDLFSLAQTIAALTGGSISIEDMASRVLAYSRAGDEVDELRRLSILGREGPEPYLALLREWGVYERLRSGEEVVHIDERPELGIRRRIAVGVHAGSRQLGTVWVQEGSQPLTEHADRALLGAARLAALHLVRRRDSASAGLRLRENLLAGMLDGRIAASAVAGQIGADPAKPAAVVVFALRAADRSRSELELHREEMIGIISVHAAAYRRSALATALGGRVYVLLPELTDPASVLALTREALAATRRHLGVPAQAAVGSVVAGLDEVAASRQEADRVLAAIADQPEVDVAALADVRTRVLIGETLALLAEHPRIRDPQLAALVGTELGRSLLAYLEAFGDVRAAAHRLHVHPNTLRYRVRRACELGDLELDDPDQRLFAQLQLRLEH
ncbi:PucR family transcriptional regulator [Kutzneria albida]|uniref:PucR family transcription regulator n=1 Tax=Kutzneria albida DSM 43870 TaxID=1449976 RepID=W5W7Q9_9PSEU|nr:PucR family transcription regulator [Kutzneria albida DSM 43870]